MSTQRIKELNRDKKFEAGEQIYYERFDATKRYGVFHSYTDDGAVRAYFSSNQEHPSMGTTYTYRLCFRVSEKNSDTIKREKDIFKMYPFTREENRKYNSLFE